MAGWSLGRILIKFPPGHPQHGLEVLMRRRLVREPNPEEEFEWLTEEEESALTQAEKRAYLERLTVFRCEQFARYLIRWNFTEPEYDEDGVETGIEKPVPPTAEGVGRLDAATLAALWLAYNSEVTTVAPPLSQPSDGGERSEVESTLSQETLSDSPRTLDTL